ncbi:MAG: chemotaxis protein CheW [Thermodesulfobacteriota bacterium]
MISGPQNNPQDILVFTLDAPQYALPLAIVERVLRAVEITPLPKAPEIVRGVINLRGRVIPVVDIRRRFGLPARTLRLDDRLLVAQASHRPVALVVDEVVGLRRLAQEQTQDSEPALSFAPHLKGVAKLEDGLALIYDLDQFLSLDEQKALDAALSGGDG